jgi:FMN phosphatase YigB (HAD superfamily)
MPPKGIFFDLYGTLLEYKDNDAMWTTWESTFHSSLQPHGLGLSHEEFSEHCHRFFGSDEPPAVDDGLTIFERRMHAMFDHLELDISPDSLRDIAMTIIGAWQTHIEIDPESIDVLRMLHADHSLALVSNFDHPPHLHRVLDDNNLREWFPVIVVSGEVGVKKPDPGIFRPALEATGLAPEDVIYLGDTADDVKAARAAGIRPILIDRGIDRANYRPQDNPSHPDDVETISRLSELFRLLGT